MPAEVRAKQKLRETKLFHAIFYLFAHKRVLRLRSLKRPLFVIRQCFIKLITA